MMWVMEQVVFMSMDKRLQPFCWSSPPLRSDELTITHETIARNMGNAREAKLNVKYFENEGPVALTRGRITLTTEKG